MNDEKEAWVNAVMQSADNIRQAKSPAGFYHKTLQRIQTYNSVSTDYVIKVAAVVLLLIAVNIFTCIGYQRQNNHQRQGIQSFATEYAITGNTYNL